MSKSKYYKLKEQNEQAKQENNYLRALRIALEAVPLIENENLSDVPIIWPLVEAIKYLPTVKEGKSKTNLILDEIENNDDLGEHWKESIEKIHDKSDDLDRILEFLNEKSNFNQSKLWSKLNIDGREGSKLIHYAEQVGALEKKKENGKNILYSKKKPSLKNIEFDDKKKNIEIENKKSDFKSNNSGCGMNVMFVIIILIVVFRLI